MVEHNAKQRSLSMDMLDLATNEICYKVKTVPDSMEWADAVRQTYLNLGGKLKANTMHRGFKCVTDENIPLGEIHFKNGGKVIGKIVNLAADEAPTCTS